MIRYSNLYNLILFCIFNQIIILGVIVAFNQNFNTIMFCTYTGLTAHKLKYGIVYFIYFIHLSNLLQVRLMRKVGRQSVLCVAMETPNLGRCLNSVWLCIICLLNGTISTSVLAKHIDVHVSQKRIYIFYM